MRTTLDLDERLMRSLLEFTHTRVKSHAVEKAIEEFLERRRIERILSLRGKIKFAMDWREMEEQERKAMQRGRSH